MKARQGIRWFLDVHVYVCIYVENTVSLKCVMEVCILGKYQCMVNVLGTVFLHLFMECKAYTF